MTILKLAIRSLLHYGRRNLTLSAGVAISTTVLTGALIIGDSVKFSLEKNALYRLGEAEYAITAGDRYFTTGLAEKLEDSLGGTFIPVIKSEGMAIAEGGSARINNVQVWGVDEKFGQLSEKVFDAGNLAENKAVVSENLGDRLGLKQGDSFVLRIKKSSIIPLNAPFVSDDETSVSVRVTIAALAGIEDMGGFSLKNSQTLPFNVFLNQDFLNNLMGLEKKSNYIVIIAPESLDQGKIINALGNAWDPKDASLKITRNQTTGEWQLYSERVFIEPFISEAFSRDASAKRFILTWFVNGIRKEGAVTPYSFVSTLDTGELETDEVVVNNWLARDMNISAGEKIALDYYVVGPLRRLEERSINLEVKKIVPLTGKYGDPDLMPFLPGLSDAGHCRDWEAGIPIDLDKIRDKDEEYWNKFKGTPKAFVSVGLGSALWKNRFGDFTSIRFDPGRVDFKQLDDLFHRVVNPESLGFRVLNIRDEALSAARNGVNFSQLFLGLSFFVLVSAIMLTGLLFLLNVSGRLDQAGTLSALGFNNRMIRRIFLLESGMLIIPGALAGIFLALLYNDLVLILLNRVWNDIVRTSILEVNIRTITLLAGFGISSAIAFITIYLSLSRKVMRETTGLQKGLVKEGKQWRGIAMLITGSLSGLTVITILLWQIVSGRQDTAPFFTAGGMLLISMLIFSDVILRRLLSGKMSFYRLNHLSYRNIARNRKRSYAIIILFALGTFVVVSTGSNRKDLSSGASKKSSGTGGFKYFAESTVPVLHNINDKKVSREYGLEGDYSFVQFRRSDGDDASCLNLNRVTNPVLLGVDPKNLQGRFTFITRTDDLDPIKPWESLDKNLAGGFIPGIADQTVIQWGLGMKIGDTLLYQNASGDTFRIKLIGGLAPSIFQGNVIISDEHYLTQFPASSGSSVFLIYVPEALAAGAEEDIFRAFRDYGWQMNTTTERLAGFYSVENTYLTIFLMLGVLSLVLGTVGLGILLARSIMERKGEIVLLQAVGYKQNQIIRIVFTEYLLLLLTGILIGFLSAVIATLPSLLSANTDVSLVNLLYILLLLILNSILWIGLFTRMNVGRNPGQELRAE